MINVTKRDGSLEPLDVEKFHKVISYACEGISNVSVSEIALKSHVQFYNKIKTSDIQETIIKAASELITEETPNYQYAAGRLLSYHIRKIVYGSGSEIPSLFDHYNRIMKLGFYDKYLSECYTEEEFNTINSFIIHSRDDSLTYAAMELFRTKYLVKNRATGQLFETPQFAFMLIAMTLFSKYKEDRLKYVKEYYDAISTFDLTLPTPIMGALRTPQKQFSSCVLIETGDSLDSINASSSAIVRYVSQKAGIGLHVGNIRAIGSSIRRGDAYHTGIIPFLKHFQTAVSSCSQGSIRQGSSTFNYPIFHFEVEDLLVLKNSKGTEDNRIRKVDYCVLFNRLFYERLITGGSITLFSPHEVPEVMKAFYENSTNFKELYETAERKTSIRKKVIKASDLFSTFMQERKDTGRIYLMNIDNANDHGSFVPGLAPIKMTNLCTEISLPSLPLNDVNDPNGMIALCTLSSINMGKIKSPEDFKRPCELAVRALDELLDYQDYPVPAAKNSTQKFRPLGVGLTNLAYWMAMNDMTYSEPDLKKLSLYFEHWSYYLIKTSADLAVEKGQLGWPEAVKYSQGILPIDTYNKNVDMLVSTDLHMEWEALRNQLKETGIRNATLMAQMPVECQHWKNKISLFTGEEKNIHELLENQGIDWKKIEELGIPQRYNFPRPIMVNSRKGQTMSAEFYYNGISELIELEFSDGNTYKFTPNHKLLVNRRGRQCWVEIKDLVEGDDVVMCDA